MFSHDFKWLRRAGCKHFFKMASSSKTQPYDRAWERLSIFLRSNWEQVYSAGKIDLTKVFRGEVRKSILYVHLFFVKLFGCRIVQDNVPIDIAPFQFSLLRTKPHKNIYLSIGPRPGDTQKKFAGITEMTSIDINGGSAFATWLYMVDQISVNVLYVTKYRNPKVMQDTFHPEKFVVKLNIKEIGK